MTIPRVQPLRLQNFAGMVPIKDQSQLPSNYAAYSRNTWLYGGNIQGFVAPISLHTLANPSALSVYRIPVDPTQPDNFANSTWLEFADANTNVIRAPMIEDQYHRYYFASPSTIPQYNTLARIVAGQPKYTLGIPVPEVAPTLSVAGGTATSLEVRTYCYTWQSAYKEEGPPSPPSVLLTGTVDGTWTVGITSPQSSDLAGRDLSTLNLYRSVTDASGNAVFYLVANLPIGTTSYTDTALSTSITGLPQLPSTTWTAPPSDLQGMVSMNNGIIVGWRNEREIWFCEPYRPHAWPAAYSISTAYPIVGMAECNGTLIVLTTVTPYAVSGLTPATMSIQPLNVPEPCLARNSICVGPAGVAYASPNGIILINSAGPSNVTHGILSRQQWNAMGPSSMNMVVYATALLAIQTGSSAQDNGFVIDNLDPLVTYSNVSLGAVVVRAFTDEYSGSVFLIYGGAVWEWDAENATTQLTRLWRSKTFELPYPSQYAAAIIEFEIPAWVTAAPTPSSRNVSQPQTFDPTTQYALFRVYGNDSLILTREIQTNMEVVLFPGKTKYNRFAFEIEGQVKVKSIQVGPSIKELQLV